MRQLFVRFLNIYHCPMHFGAFVLRMAFGITFLLTAINKIRMGYGSFAEGLVNADNLLTHDIPQWLIYVYGYITPGAELLAGFLLIVNRLPKVAFSMIAALYVTFIFGQVYDSNVTKVGTEYIPALLAVVAGYFLNDYVIQNRNG